MGRLATVRARTTLAATAVTAAVLVAGSVIAVALLSVGLTTGDDDIDRARAKDLLSTAESGTLPAVLRAVDDDSVAQVIRRDGTVLASTPNASGRPAIVPPLVSVASPRLRTVPGPDDRETETYRLWVGSGPLGQSSGRTPGVTVVVGHSLETVDEATNTLRRTLFVGIPIVLVLLATSVWWLVGRALGRVDALTTAVAAIGDDTGQRVPETGVADEVGRLATTLNAMLTRLEEARSHQRRFVADASHDLQSPLAAMRTQLEVAVASPDGDPAALRVQLLSTLGELEILVQNLLQLALLDSDEPRRDDLLDLDELALEEAARIRTGARVPIDVSGVSGAPVRGDATELRRLIRNLLDNAVRHASSRVEVVVELSSMDDGESFAVLRVADDGLGVADADRERVFERFFRDDPARARGAGSGLGLSIARRIAERHHGTLTVGDGHGGDFRLVMPAAGTGAGEVAAPTMRERRS